MLLATILDSHCNGVRPSSLHPSTIGPRSGDAGRTASELPGHICPHSLPSVRHEGGLART
jgi:hypothetical protein